MGGWEHVHTLFILLSADGEPHGSHVLLHAGYVGLLISCL